MVLDIWYGQSGTAPLLKGTFLATLIRCLFFNVRQCSCNLYWIILIILFTHLCIKLAKSFLDIQIYASWHDRSPIEHGLSQEDLLGEKSYTLDTEVLTKALKTK